MLLDTNIIIYASQKDQSILRQFMAENSPTVSVLSYVEVLEYNHLTQQQSLYLEKFFQLCKILPISQAVLEKSSSLRQLQKINISNAIIAATAIVYNLTLVTKNKEDFGEL